MYKAVWVALGIITAVLLPFFMLLIVVSTKDSFLAWQETRKYISKNENTVSQIFTEIYPQAKSCAELENSKGCQSLLKPEVQKRLPNFSKVRFNQGIYFVELSEGRIKKLFQDGTLITVPSSLQKQIGLWVFAKFKMSAFSALRVSSHPIFRFFGDFHSEAELIVPLSSGFSEVRVVVVPYGD